MSLETSHLSWFKINTNMHQPYRYMMTEGTNLAKESKTTSYLYTDQLRHLPVISKTLKSVISKIRQEQDHFVQRARQNEIDKNLQYIQFEGVWHDNENSNEELLATSSRVTL